MLNKIRFNIVNENVNINFASVVICKMGIKVIFLTNSILDIKEITNGSLEIIIRFLENRDIETAFFIKEGI
jgi:hypothetical protein